MCSRSYWGPASMRWTLQAIVIVRGQADSQSAARSPSWHPVVEGGVAERLGRAVDRAGGGKVKAESDSCFR